MKKVAFYAGYFNLFVGCFWLIDFIEKPNILAAVWIVFMGLCGMTNLCIYKKGL